MNSTVKPTTLGCSAFQASFALLAFYQRPVATVFKFHLVIHVCSSMDSFRHILKCFLPLIFRFTAY